MNYDFEEIFAEDGKNLTTLVQEWINENIENITCKIKKAKLEENKNN